MQIKWIFIIMKILCVIDSLGSGGAQRQLVELAVRFKERGHNVTFLVYHEKFFFKRYLDEAKIPVNVIIETNYLKRLFKMRKYIRKGNYDAVLSFLEAANFICEFAGLPWRKWKLVVGERSANPNINKSLKLMSFRWFHLFADFIVANSHENIKLIQRINPIISSRRLKVIYNMVDLDRWKPLPDFTPSQDGKFLLVVAASHIYYKNLNGLVEALHLLSKDELSKLTISWYGDCISEPYFDNSYIEGLQKIREYQLGNVISFFPAAKNIKEIIQNADGVALFSFFEGFPNTVCEAMACGKPVLSSNVSDIPIILSYDALVLFDPYNIDSIKKSLSYILSLSKEKLKEIGSMNLKIAKSRFDKEKIVNQYLQLLLK